ncbi:MAG: glycosyltransferase family 4 protein [bacterium]|nr:MAG: glycosyltransferase family 4 protein [bacterium]
MRIAVISSTFPPQGSGGITSAHYNLFRGLTKRGYVVRAFTFQDEVKERGPHVTRYGAGRLTKMVIYYLLRIYFRLRGCRSEAYQLYDILQSFAATRISRDLEKFRPEVVIIPDHGAPALYLKKPEGSRFVWMSHHNPARFLDQTSIPEHCAHDASLALRLEERALRKVDHVVCPSEYMKEVFLDTYRYGGEISVIPNIVDRDTISAITTSDPRREMGLAGHDPVVYIPSAGSVFKGSDFVPEIMGGISAGLDGKVGFFLSGPVEPEVLEGFRKACPRIPYYAPGRLAYEKNISLVRGCTICVSPTLLESFGMALLEATACGLPVVAFDTGGSGEVVKDGRNGYLVPMLDVASMVRRSLEILSEGEGSFASRGLEYFDGTFSERAVLDRFCRMLDEVRHQTASSG